MWNYSATFFYPKHVSIMDSVLFLFRILLGLLRIPGNFDPWEMHSVSCNASRTTASIAQRTRFGIGDVYFLAAAYGLMEVVVDNIKRCSTKTVHLESGRKLTADVILKCIGMTPDVTVDKVVKAKFMRGLWINGDPRRVSCADADGIYASNFSATTIGPGDQNYAVQ